MPNMDKEEENFSKIRATRWDKYRTCLDKAIIEIITTRKKDIQTQIRREKNYKIQFQPISQTSHNIGVT